MESLTKRFEEEVFNPYCDLLKSEYRFNQAFRTAQSAWEEKLTMAELVNGPYLEKSQIYAAGDDVQSLPLHPDTKETIAVKLGGRSLYRHQTDAIRQIAEGNNTVVATGTSSGKTLCYQLPILNELLLNPSDGVRAIIVYPLNALVNDQLEEWGQILKAYPQITFARFTGQTPNDPDEFKSLLRRVIAAKFEDSPLRSQEREREIQKELDRQLQELPSNQLTNRDHIRRTPPNILITNFSMLEYLLERPIDDAVFRNSNLTFLVLDEVHAYRGVQATEIGFLIRRLKDRLNVTDLTCVATSATLGKRGDLQSESKVREFVSRIFDGEFREHNPIYGTPAKPVLKEPSFVASPGQYAEAFAKLNDEGESASARFLSGDPTANSFADVLERDENLFKLRSEILTTPIKLEDAAERLWPKDLLASVGLQALLNIVGLNSHVLPEGDLLPTRLHYFVKAQAGLFVCLHRQCPGRTGDVPPYFVSREHELTEEGCCPECEKKGRKSLLVEVVTCRKCGYLFCALQDLGPRKMQDPDAVDKSPVFDSFSTELGWGGESFWSYFSVEEELPFPNESPEDEEDDESLSYKPGIVAILDWCVICGRKSDKGSGDNCECPQPHLRKIEIFHRQSQHKKDRLEIEDLSKTEKKLLKACANCGTRNTSGLEPLRRFQESDDETGMAMAIPLAHFQVTPIANSEIQPRKLLCFTDNRQKAAAFPALLEEETFTHDLGRKMLEIVDRSADRAVGLEEVGKLLANCTDESDENYDSTLFLPTSRLPDRKLTVDEQRNLWLSETFAYFGIPDSARESIEDLGLVSVEYDIGLPLLTKLREILGTSMFSLEETNALLQTLLTAMRRQKAVTLPEGKVAHDDLAFGRATFDSNFSETWHNKARGWLPKKIEINDSYVTDYLKRVTGLLEIEEYAKKIWSFLCENYIVVSSTRRNVELKKLDHEKIVIQRAKTRFVCSRCDLITTFSAKGICPRKSCSGHLVETAFQPDTANLIARWTSGISHPRFYTLKSEEHTAQIDKNYAKQIEDAFRAESGINLLSSTTTFEMGINIGDLQKVLLRNAPPTSASYVQRVGRAGRGRDKNAVCVTLCKRTKYDADAWKNPSERLMMGEIKPPTVFLGNRFIAQRHFNAVIFAQFLREKLIDENCLGEIKQSVPLGPFLPPEQRKNIPPAWIKFSPTDVHLDFVTWLNTKTTNDFFRAGTRSDIVDAVGGFETGKSEAESTFQEFINGVSSELAAMLEQRNELVQQGFSIRSVDSSVQNLLDGSIIDVLAKRGFLPRYAFPLDVVNLETSISRWSSDSDVQLSRDRAMAIAEFAPGSQVIARKKVFTSSGIYIAGRSDVPEHLVFSKCPECLQIQTAKALKDLEGECDICKRVITFQNITTFVEPKAFTTLLEHGKPKETSRHRRSSLVRQRQSLTHFIDVVKESEFEDADRFKVALKVGGKLFRYNVGQQGKGFVLCDTCGHSEFKHSFKPNKNHDRLRNIEKIVKCPNLHMVGATKGIAYAHEFESFCLVVRPQQNIPVMQLKVTLAYALHKGICAVLETESSDIGVSGRAVTNRHTSPPENAEFVFFDKTPGGAGFVKQARLEWESIVKKTLEICTDCACETACYNCLKDYYNQSVHQLLDRKLVASFLTS